MPGTGSPGKVIGFLETHNGQRLAVILFSLVATLVLVAFPGTAAAMILGFPYLLFIPGFVVVRLFFWGGTSPEAKFVLSIGLSIIVLIFLGLGLALSPIGLHPDTTRASLIAFTWAAVTLDVFWKRQETKEKARATEKELPRKVKLDKVVASMLVTALAVSAISLGLVITAKYPSRTYFAITDQNGSVDFNTTREINSTFTVVLHMKNGEGSPCTFRAVVHNETWNISQEFTRTLQKNEVWNQTVDVYLEYYGKLRIDFDLYITEGGSPEYFYANLHLWLDVS